MSATSSLIPAGNDATSPQIGDLLAVHRHGPVRELIHRGQAIRPSLRAWATFTHIACVRSPDGDLIEAKFWKVRRSHLAEYRAQDYVHVSTRLDEHDQAQAAAYLDARVGAPYAVLGDIGTFVRLVTPGDGPWFATSGSVNCSGLAAEMLERGPYVWPRVAASMCPAEVARALGVPPVRLGSAR